MGAVTQLASHSRASVRNISTPGPMAGTVESMRASAISQLEARIAKQKDLAGKGGHSHAEEVAEMWKWIKISFVVAFPVCVFSAIKDLLMDHPHAHPTEVDYMKIRNKPFPWECEDCGLFDLKCWEACRLEKAAEAAGH